MKCQCFCANLCESVCVCACVSKVLEDQMLCVQGLQVHRPVCLGSSGL